MNLAAGEVCVVNASPIITVWMSCQVAFSLQKLREPITGQEVILSVPGQSKIA